MLLIGGGLTNLLSGKESPETPLQPTSDRIWEGELLRVGCSVAHPSFGPWLHAALHAATLRRASSLDAAQRLRRD
jgi:hypothetical protein